MIFLLHRKPAIPVHVCGAGSTKGMSLWLCCRDTHSAVMASWETKQSFFSILQIESRKPWLQEKRWLLDWISVNSACFYSQVSYVWSIELLLLKWKYSVMMHLVYKIHYIMLYFIKKKKKNDNSTRNENNNMLTIQSVPMITITYSQPNCNTQKRHLPSVFLQCN